MDLALQALLGSVGLVRGHHLDEAEAARLLRVWVTHDVALLHLTILLEQAADLLLRQAGVNARHEEVRARVAAVVVLIASASASATAAAHVGGRAAVVC